MSIVTKKARKGLSIATVIGLTAGLLTGVVAVPANAVVTPSLKASPSIGLRAGNDYLGDSLALITLVTNNSSEDFSGATSTTTLELGTCNYTAGSSPTSAAKVAYGVTETWCNARNNSVWTSDSITVPSDTYANGHMPVELLSTPADASEYSEFFTLANQDSSVLHTVTAELQFASGGHSAFSVPGAYKFRVYTNGTTANYVDFTITVGGDVATATLAPEYNPAPESVGMEWTLTLKDSTGAKTSLADAETVRVAYNAVGSTSVTDAVATATGSAVASLLDVTTGDYVVPGVVNPAAGKYNYSAKITSGATVVLSNIVNLVVLTVSASGEISVSAKAGVAAGLGSHNASIRTDVKTAEFIYTDDEGADAAGEFVWFTVNGEGGGLSPEDLTVVSEGKWVQLGASGTAIISVTNGITTIAAGQTYTVDATGAADAMVATYRDAGYAPGIDLVTTTGWTYWEYGCYDCGDGWASPPNLARGKTFTVGSTVSAPIVVRDIFGTAMSNVEVTASVLSGAADLALYDAVEVTDSSGKASFTFTNTNKAADLNAFNAFDLVKLMHFEVTDGDYTNTRYLNLEMHFARSTDAASLNVTADGETAADFNAAGYTKNVDTLDAVSTDNVRFDYEVVNADGVEILGAQVTLTTSAGGYASRGWLGYQWNPEAIGDMAAGSVTVTEGDGPSLFATSTKTGAATFTVSSGSLSTAFNLTYVNQLSDARFLDASSATATSGTGQVKRVEFKVTDRFGNAVAGVDVLVSSTGVGRLVNGLYSVKLTTDVNGVVAVDVNAAAGEVGAQTVSASATGGQLAAAASTSPVIPAGRAAASSVITWADAEPSIKIGTLKGKVVVKVLNAADKAVAIFIGGKLATSFVATSNYVVKQIKAAKGKRSVTVRIYSANLLVKRIVTVK